VAVRDDGVPVIVYTSVLAGHLDTGRIALATGESGWHQWTADAGGPVLPGPPPGLAMTHFRDPYVWRSDEGWRMAIGGGLTGGRAVALQYSSPDLANWDLDGILAERPAAETEPLWAGSVWECVQFFPLHGRWVLLFSAWHEGKGLRVLCAVGEYDGARFRARTWQPFTATDAQYATTSFLDRSGRRCALSWVREPAPAGATWAGMLSLPVVLALEGDRVTVAPHPDVDSLRGALLLSLGPTELSGDPLVLGVFDPWLDVGVMLLAGAAAVRLAVGSPEVLELRIDPAAGASVVSRAGRPDETIPLGSAVDGAFRVRVLLDAGLAEVFSGGATAAVGVVPMVGPAPIVVSAPGGRGEIEALTVFAVQRA
jgi:beta-fructofuranosidase